jgi:putative hydrolase of the HAD superfamily
LKNLSHVFFDLDHTLWDNDRNVFETLEAMAVEFGLLRHTSVEKLNKVFNKVNEKMWHQYNLGQVDKEHIRTRRFAYILKQLKVQIDAHPQELSDYFVRECSQKSHLMPHAEYALFYLQDKYELGIITNGFDDSQQRKINASGLDRFFKVLVTSETTGARKPEPGIFHHAMEISGASARSSVMIGDNPHTDVRGAENAGMHAIFYNPSGKRRSVCQWEVQSLEELTRIL